MEGTGPCKQATMHTGGSSTAIMEGTGPCKQLRMLEHESPQPSQIMSPMDINTHYLYLHVPLGYSNYTEL